MANRFRNGSKGQLKDVNLYHTRATVSIVSGKKTIAMVEFDDPVGEALAILGKQPATELANNEAIRKLARMVLAVEPDKPK